MGEHSPFPAVQDLPDSLADSERDLAFDLLSKGLINREALQRIESVGELGRVSLVQLLLRLGLIAEDSLMERLAEVSGCPIVQDDELPFEPLSSINLQPKFLKYKQVLPLESHPDALTVAMANPLDAKTVSAIALACRRTVHIRTAPPSTIERLVNDLYFETGAATDTSAVSAERSDVSEEDVERLRDLASEAPVIRLVSSVIDRAVEAGASDVHFEPDEQAFRIRFRLDGELTSVESHRLDLAPAIVSRIKVMAHLDISERRLPQDGRIQSVVRGRAVDLRISTMPTFRGESIVIRILDRDSIKLDFDALGIAGDNHRRLIEMVSKPNGIVLVTGPTGSGKTTTLYTVLSGFDAATKNILTVEDPVEYRLPAIKQVQVNSAIDLDFPRVLRSMLRHDPDIILVGEIRDQETANIAVQAALTGHLVLSTLHTNDAIGAISRLLDMGIADYLLTSAVTGMIAQRLVRRLCTACKKPYTPDRETLTALGLEPDDELSLTLFKPAGCPACQNTGFKGRTSILETVPMSGDLRRAVLKGEGLDHYREIARSEGTTSLYEDGISKVVLGETALEEVVRVTQDMGIGHGAI